MEFEMNHYALQHVIDVALLSAVAAQITVNPAHPADAMGHHLACVVSSLGNPSPHFAGVLCNEVAKTLRAKLDSKTSGRLVARSVRASDRVYELIVTVNRASLGVLLKSGTASGWIAGAVEQSDALTISASDILIANQATVSVVKAIPLLVESLN
jgi:hypothetical protein